MVTATTTKKSGKKKGAKKKSGERNATPPLTTCPFTANGTRPHPTESSGRMATRALKLAEDVATWTASVRAAFAAGKKANELPEFPLSKFADPNIGLMSRTAFDTLLESYDEALDAETKTPAMFPTYNPVFVDLVHLQNCTVLRKGSKKNNSEPPKKWDAKTYGSWHHEYETEDGSTIEEPSYWFFDQKVPRRCHAETAEGLIDDPEKNIVTIGNNRYVVGTGTHDGAACFKIWQTTRGNYRAGDDTRKRQSLAGLKEIRDVIFRIEDRPTNGGGFTVKGEWADVREMVYLPGQVLTAGNLVDGKGKVVDAKAIRALGEDAKGYRFKTLEAPIIGKAIPWAKIWAQIQISDKKSLSAMRKREGRSEKWESGSPQDKSITNLLVHGKRVDPSERTPFGLRGSQAHQVAYIVASGEGRVEEGNFSMGVVVGARANFPYNVGIHATKEEGVEAPKPKKDAAAKKDTKKGPKSAPKSKAAKKVADAAPLVESDTADEPEIVETESETVDVTSE